MPIIEFFISWGMKTGFRLLDRSFTSDYYRSKKRSVQLYVDTYSGPEFMIHFRYSTILVITFVTLMYGTLLPLLFPIAAWSFFVLYSLERLLVCYYYKQPPAFDEKMTVNALNFFLWAPIVYMMTSYWGLSNNQIFGNLVFKLDNVRDLIRSGHTVASEMKDLHFDQAFPLLMLLGIFLVFIPFGSLFTLLVSYIKPGLLDINLNIDEDLNNYFEALEDSDKQWMI